MDYLSYTLKWLELLFRWGHVLFAILWIGNSFLFNYLDNKLNKNINNEDIDGEGYLMHSGYFYKLTRLKKSPPLDYLKSLIIFKWQSYLTFITGILLLIVLYYYNSKVLMVDKRVLELTPLTSISISIFSLIISWFVYDLLCKSKLIKNTPLFGLVMLLLLVAISFIFTKIYGPKFAFLSVGLVIGTNMFMNVFTVIIPNQMNIIKSSEKNEKFDTSLSLAAKQRSIHNNYSTFLVLFIISKAPTEVALAFIFGQPHFGLVIIKLLNPKFFKALAQAPIFSPSCGFIRIKPNLFFMKVSWSFFFE